MLTALRQRLEMRIDFDAMTNAIHQCALDPSGWSELLGQVAIAVQADKIQLLSPGPAYSPQGLTVIHGGHEQSLSEYGQHFRNMDLWVAGGLSSNIRSGSVVAADELVDRRKFLRSEFYNDFLRRYDIAQAALVCVYNGFEGRPPLTALSVCRGHRQPFSNLDLGVLRRLVPHLQTSISNHWKWLELNSALRTARGGLESISAGMFMLGDRARLIYANKKGETLLVEGLWLFAENNVVRCGRKVTGVQTADRALDELLNRGIGFSVQLSTGLRHAILVGVPCPQTMTATVGATTPDTRAILWLIQETISRSPIQLAAQLFQLTGAEQRLLALLGKGSTLSEAAGLLGVKPNTVRSQLKSIFAKTGRNRQSELLALIHRIAMLELS